jgi:hypothetical protein
MFPVVQGPDDRKFGNRARGAKTLLTLHLPDFPCLQEPTREVNAPSLKCPFVSPPPNAV